MQHPVIILVNTKHLTSESRDRLGLSRRELDLGIYSKADKRGVGLGLEGVDENIQRVDVLY